jgi:hypothetical protein
MCLTAAKAANQISRNCIAADAVAPQQAGLKSDKQNNAETSPKYKPQWAKALDHAKNE